jgi:thioredoxin 1
MKQCFMSQRKLFSSFVFFIFFFLMMNMGTKMISAQQNSNLTSKEQAKNKYKVTFVELGSVRCIPCKQMQAVMKSIEQKYGDQVKIIFYDVWTPDGKPYADQYKIDAIPTQVFLDAEGKEFYRHEGFFAEEELVKVLQTNGVK